MTDDEWGEKEAEQDARWLQEAIAALVSRKPGTLTQSHCLVLCEALQRGDPQKSAYPASAMIAREVLQRMKLRDLLNEVHEALGSGDATVVDRAWQLARLERAHKEETDGRRREGEGAADEGDPSAAAGSAGGSEGGG